MREQGLAVKFAAAILAGSGLVFALLFSYDFAVARRILSAEVESKARNKTRAAVNFIDAALRPVQKIPDTLARLLETGAYDGDPARVTRLLRLAVGTSPEIYGMTAAFAPGAYAPGRRWFAPYVFRRDGALSETMLGGAAYQYSDMEWYRRPRELAGPYWSEPYLDRGGGDVLMATYSVPFYSRQRGRRVFRGVTTADISLRWLQEVVASYRTGRTGYSFLISREGRLITHPDQGPDMARTVFAMADERQDGELRRVAKEMVAGRTGLVHIRDPRTGLRYWMTYMPLATAGWSLGMLFPKEEIMVDMARLSHDVLLLGLAGLLLLAAMAVLIARNVTRPLVRLAESAGRLGAGDLDAPLEPVRRRDEVGRLNEAFRSMRDSLKRHIRELTEATAQRERAASELRIAHDIQRGMLPREMPRRGEFEVAASLEAAREVGGDLYDCFLLPDERLCFAIGDVSGKGVPGALFMAVTSTLLRTAAEQALGAGAILARVNEQLCRRNEASMFVTAVCGVLDLRTGRLGLASAGHNPPVLRRAGQPPQWLDLARAKPLGVEAQALYRQEELALQPGDALLLYTDGVTEAWDEQEKLYSDERLLALLSRAPAGSAASLAEAVAADVKAFAGGAPQADDIAILALRWLGPAAPELRVEWPGEVSVVTELARQLEDFGRRHGWPVQTVREVNLALEELAVNAVSHGRCRRLRLSLRARPGEAEAELRDDGSAFDPFSVSLDGHADGSPGGWGVKLARVMADSAQYRREADENVVILRKRFSSAV